MEIWESSSQQLSLKPAIIFLSYRVLCSYYFILIFCLCTRAAFSQTNKVLWLQPQFVSLQVQRQQMPQGCSGCWGLQRKSPVGGQSEQTASVQHHNLALLSWAGFWGWAGRDLRTHLVPALPPRSGALLLAQVTQWPWTLQFKCHSFVSDPLMSDVWLVQDQQVKVELCVWIVAQELHSPAVMVWLIYESQAIIPWVITAGSHPFGDGEQWLSHQRGALVWRWAELLCFSGFFWLSCGCRVSELPVLACFAYPISTA